MTLYMSSLSLDLKRLHQWAHSAAVPVRDGDLGYAVHSALRATFGELGPQPFAIQALEKSSPRVLGYGAVDGAELRLRQAEFADPLLAAVFPGDGVLTKPLPLDSFTTGRRLAFSVRVCPVIRQDAGDRTHARETDAFLAQDPSSQWLGRETVYRRWLAERVQRDGAAVLVDAQLAAFRRIQVSRRDAGRKPRLGEKPDASFEGLLEVGDPAAFARLLTRGVGRHRAFGFGMLLLRRPPGASC